MVIGFTGTRNGMTNEQISQVCRILHSFRASDECEGLHGDCIGADADFDAACAALQIPTQCRPCTFENLRARCTDAISKPMAPMDRNRAIVADADVMIACPPNYTPIKRGSGTWATIGFAKRAGKRLIVVYPDGRVDDSCPSIVNKVDF